MPFPDYLSEHWRADTSHLIEREELAGQIAQGPDEEDGVAHQADPECDGPQIVPTGGGS